MSDEKGSQGFSKQSSCRSRDPIPSLILKRFLHHIPVLLILSVFFLIGFFGSEMAHAGQFSTEGHPKARGVNLTLSYPEGWLSVPGERPHMIQSFAVRRPWGVAMAILGVRKVDVPRRGYFTDREAE